MREPVPHGRRFVGDYRQAVLEPERELTTGRAYRVGGIALGGAVTLALPSTFPSDGGPSELDDSLAEPVHTALDSHHGVADVLVIPSNAYILLPLLLLGCAWFGYRREWSRAALMLVAPELIVAINTWLLKPLWHRHLHDYLAYPSGHTVHLVAIATAFIVLTDSPRARAVVLTVSVVGLAAAAVGMIALGYHLPTDILGGIAAAIALTTALCWAAQAVISRAIR